MFYSITHEQYEATLQRDRMLLNQDKVWVHDQLFNETQQKELKQEYL